MSEMLKEWPHGAKLVHYDDGWYSFTGALAKAQAVEAALAILEREGLVVGEGTYHYQIVPRIYVQVRFNIGITERPVLIIRDPRQEVSDERPA